MASFLDELGMTLFGQQELPDYQQVSSGDLLGRATGLLPQIGAFNQQVAQQQLGLVPFENQIRSGRFGSAINPLQEAYTANILSNLNLGNAIPADVQQQAIQGALQGSAASGFGLSPGGRALVARDLGLTSMDIGRQRRGEAFGALQAFPGERVQGALSPTTALGLERASIDEANMRRAQEASLRNSNRAAIISSISEYAKLGGAVLGTAVGSAFGTTGWGKSAEGVLGGLGGAMGGAGGGGGAASAAYGSGGASYGGLQMGSGSGFNF